MPKVTIEFDLDDHSERMEHKRMINATNAYIAFHNLHTEIFRPYRKHGYNNRRLEKLFSRSLNVKDLNGEESTVAEEIMEILEEMFHNILENNKINMDDLD